ncbi:MAG: DUF4411 family protein [Corynebacterium sp.]|nr:DUF4411 family protein [Corynebacterium sp.]MDO4762122.1 DUF4411 family protein [Corynebacterium sp.]
MLDTNVVIALEQTYPRTIFPSLWNQFAQELPLGRVFFHAEVKKELTVWNSPVSRWFQANTPDTCIIHPDEQELDELGQVADWAENLRHPKYIDAAVDEFFKVADSWLVASAKRHRFVIVTNEKPAPQSIAKVKIPDAAAYFHIPCVDTIGMFQRLGWVF